MRMPPWAIEAIRNGVADVARKASDAETINKVKEQAAELLRDLPENASRGIDAVVKSATERVSGAIDQGRESILRWRERQTDFGVRMCNVQGLAFSEFGTGIAVSDDVLQMGCAVLRGDGVQDEIDSRLDEALARLLDVDAHGFLLANNLDAAVASLGAIGGARTMVMHRSQAIRLPSGTPLPDALSQVDLVECGGVQAIEPGDFDAISDPTCVLLADDGQHAIEPIDFGSRDLITIAIVPYATIAPTHPSIPSVRTMLESGIDLVVTQGGPLIGAPPSGIIAGNRALLDRVTDAQAWRTHTAGSAVKAMTLEAMRSGDPSPLATLIETNEENLRSRAERMAIRLTADEAIVACQITDRPASLVHGGRWEFPSRQIRLRHKSLSAANWARSLRDQDPAIVASVDEEDVVIDLRWLPASEDSVVADALCSMPGSIADSMADSMAEGSEEEELQGETDSDQSASDTGQV